jgi:polyphosphate kinase
MKLIDREIRNAKKGKPAWMIIKVNNLVDKKLVNRLYEAGEAGVKIDLIVRGVCTLIPQRNENIRAVRIVDRFLEHSRIFAFCNAENPEYFIGSSDWMERNLDQRFEVVVPIKDPVLRQQIWDMLQIQISDNIKARLISATRPNEQIVIPKNVKHVRSQMEIYKYLKKISEPQQ